MPTPEAQALYSDMAHGFNELVQQQHTAERQQQEATRFHDTCKLIAGVGASEAEALTLLTLWQAGVDLMGKQLQTALKGRLAENPAWTPHHKTLLGYCENSFTPLDLVVRGIMRAVQNTAAYKIHERVDETGIPIAGLLSDWSLRHPKLSVQQVIGPLAAKSGSRFSEARVNILLDLLTAPHGDVATDEINGLSDIPTTVYDAALALGTRVDDWITSRSILQDNDRLYRVLDPGYHGSRPLQQLLLETQLVYGFIATRRRGQTFTHRQVLKHVMSQLSQIVPDADLALARYRLSITLGAKGATSYPGIERLETSRGQRKTKLAIVAKHRQPLTDLANIILAIHDHNPDAMNYGRQRAQQIISRPNDVAQLLNKSYDYSPFTRPDTAEAAVVLTGILAKSSGPLTVRKIHQAYNKSARQSISHNAIVDQLYALAAAGHIRKLQGERGSSTRIQDLRFEIRQE